MARSNSIAATLSAAIVLLSRHASSAAVEEPNNDTSSNIHALRGNRASETLPDNLIPMDDIRRTTNPFELAAAQREADENHNDGRELQDGSKRQQRKREQEMEKNSAGYSSPETACSEARPNKCGCPEVYLTDYRGTLSTTEKGYSCRSWTSTSMHHYPDDGLEGGAVCRNPGKVADRAWCFTDHEEVVWDYCDVDECGDDGYSSVVNTGTTGTNVNVPGCVDVETYYGVDADIAAIKEGIEDVASRVHFVGGVLRLAAHDFMDYDQNDEENPMGMDGCLDWTSLSNLGLSTIWNEHSELYKLHQRKYHTITRADFWLICANAIIRQESVNQSLDLINTFYWGRKEADSCVDSALRLPSTTNCQQVEGLFLDRMGLKWGDAVALLGAHTVGRGHQEFSGHHGMWVPNDTEAQIFDKRYYEEIVLRAWSPRTASVDPPLNDWTTGISNNKPKMMLNTDLCLFFDVDETSQCCTRTNMVDGNGRNRCESDQETQCKENDSNHPRWEAAMAVRKYLGGSSRNSNQEPFYQAFKIAWFKAVMNGMYDLKPVMDHC